jgi:hypothetical protein
LHTFGPEIQLSGQGHDHLDLLIQAVFILPEGRGGDQALLRGQLFP